MGQDTFPAAVTMIEEILIKCAGRPAFELTRRKAMKQHMARELPHPTHVEPSHRDDVTQLRRRYIDAWDYGLREVTEEITPKTLVMVNTTLHPVQRRHPNTGYRIDAVRFEAGSYSPPSPAHIPNEVERTLNTANELSPLEGAIYIHFHLSRIQPFEGTNKTTARIIQNALLCNTGYLPVPVMPGQRRQYRELIDEGSAQYKKGEKRYLHEFSNFIVHNALAVLQDAGAVSKKQLLTAPTTYISPRFMH